MLARFGRTSLAIVLGALALAACDTTVDVTNPGGNKGRLTVKLTDAPGDLAEVWVKINKIVLEPAEGQDSTTGRIELTPTSTDWIDLLSLAGGATTDLVSDTVPPGTYRQVKVVVCDMYIRTTDGMVVATPGAGLPDGVTATPGSELKLTSQCQSGFKVNIPDGVTIGDGNSTLLVDFDTKHSFLHEAGKSGKWIVTPVLHGAVRSGGEAGPGAIAGTVTLPNDTVPFLCGGDTLAQSDLLAKFVPTATADTVVFAGVTTDSGTFRIANVPAGTYTLGAENVGLANGDSLLFTAAATPASVAVTDGQTASANYAVSAVTCKAHT